MKSGVYTTCCLLLLSGCAHDSWLAARRGLPRESLLATTAEAIELSGQRADAGPLPRRSSVPLLRAQNPDNPGVSLTSSSASKTAAVSHDAATLALIERETRSFSPQDRDRAVTALKAIPSESVPAVLQLWKAGLISPLAHPSSPVILAPATAADLPAPGSFGSSATAHNAQADTGLGQKSPWPTSTVRHADYAPQGSDSGSRLADGMESAGPDSLSLGDIPRISSPTAGYSPPFSEQSTNVAQPRDWNSMDDTAAGSQVLPADWEYQHGSPSNIVQINGSAPSHFSSDPRQQLVTPRDWQGQPSPVAPVQIAPRSNRDSRFSAPPDVTPADYGDARSDAQYRDAQYGDGPVIRPRSRSGGTQTSTAERPVTPGVQQLGFSQPAMQRNFNEQGLVPGQLLPGFEVSTRSLPNMSGPRIQPAPANREPSVNSPQIRYSGQENEIERASFAAARGSSTDRTPPVVNAPGAIQPAMIQPGTIPPAQSSGDVLGLMIRATEAEVARLTPGHSAEELQYYLERHVYLRLLYLMSGQTEFALRPIPGVPAADQEFWTQVLWGMHNYFDLKGVPNHSERAAQTISQFNTAMLRLKERAPLELKHVSFCHQIEGFGEYNTYSRDEFTPGQRVLVYAEVGNFHSELSAEGIYRTRLKSTLQFVSPEAPQQPVDVKVYPVTEDYCRNHRRDYFHSYVVEIPVRCVRGSYVLQLVVEDELSGKVATYPIPFVVR